MVQQSSEQDLMSVNHLWGAIECVVSDSFLFDNLPVHFCRILYMRAGEGHVLSRKGDRLLCSVQRQTVLLQAGEGVILRCVGEPLHFLCILVECPGEYLPPVCMLKQAKPELQALLSHIASGQSKTADIQQLMDMFRLKRGGQRSATADLLKNILDHRYAEHLCLNDFSVQLGVNKYRLVKEFKKQYGVPPIKYLLCRQIDEAAALLVGTTLRVGEIGNRVGLCNPTYFTKAFSARLGCTPRAYRHQFSKAERAEDIQ